jgi:hypothetical protein
MRAVGGYLQCDLSNFEQSWPWWWTKLGNGRRGSLAMFPIPAYDPVAIVMIGFGVVLAAVGICIVIAF